MRHTGRVDLEQFYAGNPQRRHSEELEFGRDWSDGVVRCGISWIAATGELYVMREPYGTLVSDPIGDTRVLPMRDDQLGVDILGVVQTKALVEAVMSGWEEAMPGPNSLAWVRQRLAGISTEREDAPGLPSDDLDGY